MHLRGNENVQWVFCRPLPCLHAREHSDNFPAVNLSNYLKMDPHLLVGLLNTELRNHCDSLDDLVKTHHLDSEVLVAKMATAGYIYQMEINQFR